MQPPTAAQNQNQKGDRKNANSASTASNISAVADVNQESESSDLTEYQKATSSSKTYDWFEEVITEENTDRQAWRQDSVTGAAEINFGGAREVYLCEFERGTGAREIYSSVDQSKKVKTEKKKVFVQKVL